LSAQSHEAGRKKGNPGSNKGIGGKKGEVAFGIEEKERLSIQRANPNDR